MPGRRTLLLAAALTVGFVASAAPAQARGCAGPRVASGAHAFLFTGPGAQGTELRGCHRRTRRPITLAESYPYGAGGESGWDHPVLAGSLAAFATSNAWKCSTADVRVVDLRTGRTVNQVPAGSAFYESDANGCNGYGAPTTALAVRSDALVAFITHHGRGYEVTRAARGGRLVRLEHGPAVDPRFIRVTRSDVRWVSGGTWRSAPVPRLR